MKARDTRSRRGGQPLRRAGRQLPRGLALIEVLIATLVLGSGLVALAQGQARLWQGVDHSRDHARALREAQADLERARGFVTVQAFSVPGGGNAGPSWDEVAGITRTVGTTATVDGPITVERTVQTTEAERLKAITSLARWTDRRGQVQTVALSSLVAATDVRWSAWLGVAPGGSTIADLPTAPGLPPTAQPVPSTNELVWRPWPEATTVWLFDRGTGEVTRRCEAPEGRPLALLRASDLRECQVLSGLLVAGTVRFATDQAVPDARAAENPLGPALPLGLQLSLNTGSNGAHPTWTCSTDAPATLPANPRATVLAGAATVVRFACVVQRLGAPAWSGRLDVLPQQWVLATSAADADPARFRVCRYSADLDGNGRIDNAEHPASYLNVNQALSDQHFLVVRAGAACPVETLALRQWADDSTVAHQP